MAFKNERINNAQEYQEKAAGRAPYDSDLSDGEWKLVAPLFARRKNDGRGRRSVRWSMLFAASHGRDASGGCFPMIFRIGILFINGFGNGAATRPG